MRMSSGSCYRGGNAPLGGPRVVSRDMLTRRIKNPEDRSMFVSELPRPVVRRLRAARRRLLTHGPALSPVA